MFNYAPKSSGDLPIDIRDEAKRISGLTGLRLEQFIGPDVLKSFVLRKNTTFNKMKFDDEP